MFILALLLAGLVPSVWLVAGFGLVWLATVSQRLGWYALRECFPRLFWQP
jgi:hypothetical protein